MATTSDLHYDFRDIFKAPRIALSGKNLLAQARTLVFGYAAYLILTYIAMLIEGNDLSVIWANYFLFPFTNLGLSHWYTKLIWFIGIAGAAAFYDYGNLTVAKLALEELKGNLFFPLKTAFAEARANLRPFWVAALLLVILIVVLSLLQGVIGLVELIPVVGPVLYAILYVVPFFLWSLFIVFIAFGLATAILTLPAIVTARSQDAFGATFYIYNIIWTQPFRWLAGTIIGLALAKVGVWILGYFFMRALQLTNVIAAIFSGEKASNIILPAYSALDPVGRVINFFTTLYPGSHLGYTFGAQLSPTIAFASLSGGEYLGSLIIAIGLIVVWLVIVSYGINIVTCSQLITFILVRYHEDGERLADRLATERDDPHELKPRSAPPSGTKP
jgi:hypothetical protein